MQEQQTHQILVVDDDQDIRSVVAASLSTLGFPVLEAENGVKALELFEEHQPSLVILDIMMPQMDGNEVCKRIRQSEYGALVPILMLTAKTGVEDKVGSLEGGADDYVTKPFHYRELQARIQALLRVRELNLELHRKNIQLQNLQQQVVEQERQALATQMVATIAHNLGQPLSAIRLNCHLLKKLPPEHEQFRPSIDAIASDAERMSTLVDQLRQVDARDTADYRAGEKILRLRSDDE